MGSNGNKRLLPDVMSTGKVWKIELIEFFHKRNKVFIQKTITNVKNNNVTGEIIKEHNANRSQSKSDEQSKLIKLIDKIDKTNCMLNLFETKYQFLFNKPQHSLQNKMQ